VEPLLIVTLRDVLCSSLSLDDGLSAIQNLAIGNTSENEILFEIARVLEEIILRRPGLASAKLTELTVRLTFNEDRVLPEMLTLLDVRYTNSFRRSETELLPDIEAIPQLLDILGQLAQSLTSALNLNLRPLLPFLTDEVSMTLDAIQARGHEASTALAIHEVHYLTSILIQEGFSKITARLGNHDLLFETMFDYSCVLTELGMFQESRNILHDLEKSDRAKSDKERLAAVVLQLGVNDTRDDTVHHEDARAVSDRAAQLYEERVDQFPKAKDDLGLAHLIIGSSILANGWREGVPEAIDRLEKGLQVYERIEAPDFHQSLHWFRSWPFE
jgi:hypothetical protein